MNEREVSETVFAFGHENIRATHKTTLELTKGKTLSRAGDCIIAVGATKAFPDFSEEFKEKLRRPNARLIVTLSAEGVIERITANGSPDLVLAHSSEMVVRKSFYVDSRTLAVGADKAARDLSRQLIEKMRDPNQRAKITLTVAP